MVGDRLKRVCSLLIVLLVGTGFTPLCSATAVLDETPATEQVAAKRDLLLQTDDPDIRTGAALDLVVVGDAEFLQSQLENSTDDGVVASILTAVKIRATSMPTTPRLGEDILALAANPSRAEVADGASKALEALYRAHRDELRPLLVTALGGGHAPSEESRGKLRAASRAMAGVADLADVEPLLSAMEAWSSSPEIATELAASVDAIIPLGLGPEPARWRRDIAALSGKSREAVLVELVTRQRGKVQQLRQEILDRDAMIYELKVKADENDLKALAEDLTYLVPAVRRFAAETLRRRIDEWNSVAERKTVVDRLSAGTEPPEVAASFIALLEAIDRKSGQSGPDPERDAIVVASLESSEPVVVAAAAIFARQLSVPSVRDAVMRALARLSERPWSPAARAELVKSAGPLGLKESKDPLVFALRNDDAVEVRVEAVNAIGALELAEVRDDLAWALINDPDWRVRRRAAAALPRVAGEGAIPVLIERLVDPRPEVRIDVVEALSTFRNREVGGALIPRLLVEDEILPTLIKAIPTTHPDALASICAVVARLPAPEAGKANQDLVWFAVRDALPTIVNGDVDRWETVAKALESRPARAAWAVGQKVRLLEQNGSSDLERERLRQARLAYEGSDLAMLRAVSEAGLTDSAASNRSIALFRFFHAVTDANGPDPTIAIAGFTDALKAGLEEPYQGTAARMLARLQFTQELWSAARATLVTVKDFNVADLRLLAQLDRRESKPLEGAKRLRALLTSDLLVEPTDRRAVRIELAECLLDANDLDGVRKEIEGLEFPVDAVEMSKRLATLREKSSLDSESSAPIEPEPPSRRAPERSRTDGKMSMQSPVERTS